MYLRFQPLGTLLTAVGISPHYVITLEVPGRSSGLIRRTTLVRVARDGGRYLVALAGESEWVRNVRAAGRVVLGRRHRHAARLADSVRAVYSAVRQQMPRQLPVPLQNVVTGLTCEEGTVGCRK